MILTRSYIHFIKHEVLCEYRYMTFGLCVQLGCTEIYLGLLNYCSVLQGSSGERTVRKLEGLAGDEWLESEILVVLPKKLAACCKRSHRKAVFKQLVSLFFLSWFKFCC